MTGLSEILNITVEDLPRGVPVELNGGLITIHRPSLFEGHPVPDCDVVITKFDTTIGMLLTALPGKKVRIENVPRKDYPYFIRQGFKPLGPLCDRVLVKDAV